MPDKKCPRCRLWNSETATICDCGYDFSSGTDRRDFPYSRPVERKAPLDLTTSGWSPGILALCGIIFLLGLAFLSSQQSPFSNYGLFLWIANGTIVSVILAREVWLRRRYRKLLPSDSPTSQARIIGRSTRKVYFEYGSGIDYELVIQFHPAQAPGAPETLTLSAHVSPSTYADLAHTDVVTIRYSRQDPRIVLIAGEP